MNSGRPREGLAATTQSEQEFDDFPPDRITDALYWDGDSGTAASAVRERVRRTRVLASGAEDRRAQYDDICLVQQWRLARGELGAVRPEIARLRAAVVPDSPAPIRPRHGLRLHVRGPARSVARDRGSAAGRRALWPDWIRSHSGRRGGGARAGTSSSPACWRPTATCPLRSRRSGAGSTAGVRRAYLSTYLREEGRLAALVGDTAGAIGAYQHYLALRSDPEPPLRAERDSARAELARLVGER